MALNALVMSIATIWVVSPTCGWLRFLWPSNWVQKIAISIESGCVAVDWFVGSYTLHISKSKGVDY